MVRAYPQQNPFAFFSTVSFHGRNLGLAAISTLALLFIMSQLIATNFVEPTEAPQAPIKSVVMPEEMTVTTRDVEPPEPPQPLPRQTIVDPPVSNPTSPRITTVIAPPPTGTTGKIHISRGPVPVFKPQPRYPRRALIQGMEGYVVVEFTITKTGSVRDVRAIAGYDSEDNPTDIFNSSAEKAAARFKYQPQLEDGVPVEVHGVRNRISYKMAD